MYLLNETITDRDFAVVTKPGLVEWLYLPVYQIVTLRSSFFLVEMQIVHSLVYMGGEKTKL